MAVGAVYAGLVGLDPLVAAARSNGCPAPAHGRQRRPGRGRPRSGGSVAEGDLAAAFGRGLRRHAPVLRLGLQRPPDRVRAARRSRRARRPVGGRDHQPDGPGQRRSSSGRWSFSAWCSSPTSLTTSSIATSSRRRAGRRSCSTRVSDLGEGLVITEDGRFVTGNEAYIGLTGYSADELAALPSLIDLAPADQRDGADRPALQAAGRCGRRASALRVGAGHQGRPAHPGRDIHPAASRGGPAPPARGGARRHRPAPVGGGGARERDPLPHAVRAVAGGHGVRGPQRPADHPATTRSGSSSATPSKELRGVSVAGADASRGPDAERGRVAQRARGRLAGLSHRQALHPQGRPVGLG